jgi:SPP1 family predicted phage head-tail adaptor
LIRSGQLRTKLWIQRPIAGSGDGMGGGGTSYHEDVRETYGHVMPLTGTEMIVASQKGSEENCKIHIRFISDLTPKNRLQLADTTTFYDIVSVINPDLRNRELILYCRQRT